jgi:hypothetical protein
MNSGKEKEGKTVLTLFEGVKTGWWRKGIVQPGGVMVGQWIETLGSSH